MDKKAYFYIDDVIWLFRDLTRQRPASAFDNAFLKMLKKCHDDTGLTVQLNVFYRTDFFYGNDEFTLAEMTDAYKSEFEENSDWLRFAFHAKQEFPDYPYVNATYEDVRDNYMTVVKEIERFAGPASVAHAVVPHWMPISKEGCRALADCGVKFTAVSIGDKYEYNGDESALPYGHAFRLLHNRQPETMLYSRRNGDARIDSSICAYNHVNEETYEKMVRENKALYDEAVGIHFKKLCNNGLCLNLYTLEEIKENVMKYIGVGYIGVATHEQYFYPDYFAYIPEYGDRIYLAAKLLNENGYRFITADELD